MTTPLTPEDRERLARITEPGILLWHKDGAWLMALIERLEAHVSVLKAEAKHYEDVAQRADSRAEKAEQERDDLKAQLASREDDCRAMLDRAKAAEAQVAVLQRDIESAIVGLGKSRVDRIKELEAALDAEMLRLKACEHIAEAEPGWERLRNECPSTAAVASLRDALAAVIPLLERIANPQCGCSEKCRCLEPVALEIYRQEARVNSSQVIDILAPKPPSQENT